MSHKVLRWLVAAALTIAAFCIPSQQPSRAATTLLPNGMQCFTDANGPLSGGSVYMYVPATTTFKQTWEDSSQSSLNSQPILLDANGCALIYGVGVYRQQVYTGPDNTSTLVWDQLTTDTSAFNSVFWAGLSGGTANTITIVDPGFSGTNGEQINFVALNSNTGATTINPSGFGAISVVKDTTAGPVALTGGEIIAGNVISVVYYVTDNRFHLINTVIQSASGATSPLCGFSGLVVANSSGTPNTISQITAAQTVLQTTAGLVINRSNISVTVNTSLGGAGTAVAGGMDGSPVGTSQWIYIWVIDNGSAASALGSLSDTAPTMPSGYTYKCRAGAMKVDGSGNFYRTLQQGPYATYKITAGTNTTVSCLIDEGITGTYSTTSPTLTAVTVRGNTFCVPPTARAVDLMATINYKNQGASNVLVAPSTAYGGTNNGPAGSAGQIWPMYLSQNDVNTRALFNLEANTIAWAADVAGGAIAAYGWIDTVNAF